MRHVVSWLLAALGIVCGLSVAAQPAPPSPGPFTSTITFCWNGVALAACGSPGTGSSNPGGVAGITITNKSGVITVGGDPTQIAIAANPNRVSCVVNPQASDMYVGLATTAPLSNASEYWPVLSEMQCPAGYKGPVAISGLTTGAAYYAHEGTVP